jgi:phosphate transport system substrate-binding protein
MRRARYLAALVLFALIGVAPGRAAAAPTHSQIEGSGSSWSANAVNQWIADVKQQGLPVVYTAPGSAQGRKDYSFGTVDYAVTDIPFQGKDPVSGEQDTSGGRPFAYLPIVAGGTAFPYQIKVGGQQVRNLRLSGETLAKIFTNQITNWNHPQITADNNGRQLPSLPIIPVLHSEGSGSSAQFTTYLAKMFPGIWAPFNGGKDTLNEYFPRKGSAVAQNGSDGVMNFIASTAANGAIGYDEYSYALNANVPVAKVENAAHYFTLPTDKAVAKSLTQAQIDNNPASPTYLIQNLNNVYTYSDSRTYPLSSYSYLILPTGTSTQDGRLTTGKRQTLVDFLYYSICTGQREMGPVGYSPLPINLVQAGFDQVQKLKTADPGVDITRRDTSTCNNPTFIPGHPERNYLAEIAPLPPDCDKRGAGPCTDGSAGGGGNGGGGGGGAGGNGANGGPRIDPDTGQVIGASGAAGAGGDAANSASNLAAARAGGMTGVLSVLAVLELVAVLVVPVVLNQQLARRRGKR